MSLHPLAGETGDRMTCNRDDSALFGQGTRGEKILADPNGRRLRDPRAGTPT